LQPEQLKGLDSDVLGEYKSEVTFGSAEGISISWIDSTDPRVGSIGVPEDKVAAAAYTNASKTLLVEIADNRELAEPFVINISGSGAQASALHVLVVAKKFSKATLVFEHSGLGVLAEILEVDVQDEAKLNLVSVVFTSLMQANTLRTDLLLITLLRTANQELPTRVPFKETRLIPCGLVMF